MSRSATTSSSARQITVRASVDSLSPNDCQRFVAAFDKAVQRKIIGKLVAIHGDMGHMQHYDCGDPGALRFLPWHRIFLLILERELQKISPGIGIPYWDWVTSPAIPAWIAAYTPTVEIPAYKNHMGGAVWPVPKHSVTVQRTPGRQKSLLDTKDPLPTGPMITNLYARVSDFPTFTTPYAPHTTSVFEPPYGLEGLHDQVHNWVGGTMLMLVRRHNVLQMKRFLNAPADPIFWLHHSNVDRIWAEWQRLYPGQNPNLPWGSRTMDPWITFRESNILDISKLGYSYS